MVFDNAVPQSWVTTVQELNSHTWLMADELHGTPLLPEDRLIPILFLFQNTVGITWMLKIDSSSLVRLSYKSGGCKAQNKARQ
jgi:hypothetical protein